MNQDYGVAVAFIAIGFNLIISSLEFLNVGSEFLIGQVSLVGGTIFGILGLGILSTIVMDNWNKNQKAS